MKLVVNYIKHVRVFLNGEIIEPTKKKEKQVCYEIPHDAYPISVDIVHYEEPWELLAYSQPTCWQAIRNCLKEGFEHPYCCLQIVSAGPFPRRMDFEVRERCVKSGFLTYKSYYFSLTNVQVPDELDIEQTYFSSEKEERLALIIPIIKWLVVLALLLWFDVSWAIEILHHADSAETFTNLLSPIHLYGTIPILTLSVFSVFALDIRGIIMQRNQQHANRFL